jgi:predicted ester cyclase
MFQADEARRLLTTLPARQPKRLIGFNKLQNYTERTKARETITWLHVVNRHELTGLSKKEAREALGYTDADADAIGSQRFLGREELEIEVEIEGFTRRAMDLSYLDGLSDVEFTAISQVTKRDSVVTRWEVNGVHTGTMLGIAPTHRPVTITGMTMLMFTEEVRPGRGRLARATDEWTYWDVPSLLKQLGAS